jgi:predicted dehydrogenase
MQAKVRMGMVGGGKQAWIGNVHRLAAAMDGRIDLVCGALGSTRRKSVASGMHLGLPGERVYGSYREMFKKEGKLGDDARMDFVTIATPNNMHYPISMAALDAGFHVMCEKPMTLTLEEARNLGRKIRRSDRLFCLMYNLLGHPMVKEARDLVARGRLGAVRRVVVEYPQGWLATRLETTGHKQAAWRTDPRRIGPTCTIGDIGCHCHGLAEYITGLRVSEVCADLATFVRGRPVDDDGSVLLRFENGARGVLWVSHIAVGERNGLSIRVYGEKGSIAWSQQDVNRLVVHWINKRSEIRRTGLPGVGRSAARATRSTLEYPEGHLEAFSNVYLEFVDAILKLREGKKVRRENAGYPTATEGTRGMAFLDAVARSAVSQAKWVAVEDESPSEQAAPGVIVKPS